MKRAFILLGFCLIFSIQADAQKLSSKSSYDFVPGDKIIYYDDFSQDAIGDFSALWTSNGSGEVKTVNIAAGNWFHMNGEDAVYCYTRELDLPDNFIVEFDIIYYSPFLDNFFTNLS